MHPSKDIRCSYIYGRGDYENVCVLLQVAQSTLDLDGIKSILSEYRIHNADITLRYDVTADDIIDIVEGNRYSNTIMVFNSDM